MCEHEKEEWESGDELSEEEIEIEYRRQIEEDWFKDDFNPYEEEDYLNAQILAHTILHDLVEAEKYRNRLWFLKDMILFKHIHAN